MKLFNYWYLSLVLLLSLSSHSCAQNKATLELKEDEKLIKFTTDRFTLPNLHVTPDGKNIIFDVLGDIYQVPIEGGKAEVLLQDNNWKRAGKLSPDGKTLAYVSDQTGEEQVWTIDLKTKTKKVYPIIGFFLNPIEPYWNKQNELIIPSERGLYKFNMINENGEIIRHARKDEESLTHTINRKMIVNKSQTSAIYKKNDKLITFDLNDKSESLLAEDEKVKKINSFKAIDKTIVFYKNNEKEDMLQELIAWDVKSDSINILNISQSLGISTTLKNSFDFIDNNSIVLDKEGEIVRMDIETGEYESIPIEVEVKKIIKKPLRREPQYIKDSIITASVLRNPITRKDLDTIYFGAFGKLRSYAKETEVIAEVYPNKDRFEVSLSLSPDGKYLAYTTWNDIEMGHLFVRDLERGKEYQLTKTPGRYINPAWSPDGREIIFIADETETKMGIPMQTRGSNTHNHHLDIHRINIFINKDIQENLKSDIVYRAYPFSQLPRRFYPIPVYHSNGDSFFITSRNHENDLPVLLEIDLETKIVLQESPIPFHTDEIVMSPYQNHVAFVFDEQVWIDSYPYSLKFEFAKNSKFIPTQAHFKGGYVNNMLLPKAKSIYEVAPSYLSWQDENTLMWGSAEEVYTYNVRTGMTEKIADIKVQKPRAIPKTQYALTNARIITMNKQDEVIEKGTILIKDNRIESIGEVDKVKVPENYKVFDLEERTIMPGLIDVHAHYHHFPSEFQVQQNYSYIGNLAYGVTTIYDPSVNILDYREQAQMVETEQIIGPRVFASGNIIIENTGKLEYDYKKIHNSKDATRLVKSIKKLKASGPIKEYGIKNAIKRKLLKDAVDKANIRITSHQNFYRYAVSRVLQGYFSIEHEIASFILQDDIIKLIGQSGIHYTPTYIVRPGIKDIYACNTIQEENKFLRFNGRIFYQNNYESTYENQTKEHENIINSWRKSGVREHNRAVSSLMKIAKAGGKISVGGHGNPLPGIGTHWETWFMTKGISNYQALQAATINGARKLDLQGEIGSIENGKLADMVVLNSNPLEDIFNTTNILFTIKNGNVYKAETMKQIYPIKKELITWGWNSQIVLQNMKIY